MSVPFLFGNWIAGFRGFKLMESNVATAGFQVQSVEKTIQKLPHGQNRGQRVKVIYIYI